MKSSLRFIAPLVALAIAFAVGSTSASAGTLSASHQCTLSAGQSCEFTYAFPSGCNDSGQHYTRFGTINSYGSYPTHRAWMIDECIANWNPGAWTSAHYAYSPITTWSGIAHAKGDVGGTGGKLNYALQVYTGTY